MWNPPFFRFESSLGADQRVPARSLVLACSFLLMTLLFGRGARGKSVHTPATDQTIDPERAAHYFEEAEAVSRQDGGRLWGVPLYGPMLFVDPPTHSVVANQADREGKLQAKEGVFVGTLPPEMGTANTAIKWAGVDWTMVVWPLPELRQPRLRLMLHECFHRIEPKVGIEARDAVNNHLDTLDGRTWLRMEWRALERALWEASEARRKDIEDALYFRSFRRSLFPDAAELENALELHEGLAEYTGVKLSSASMAEFAMVADMKLREALLSGSNFVRSFAYTSGPAYGYLLEARGANWRQLLTRQRDVGKLLAVAYRITLPAPDRAEATRRAEPYDGDEVIAQETAKERGRAEKVNAARKRFVESPVLILPVDGQFHYTFNPNAVLPVDGDLTVYEGEVQVSDTWGVLRSSNGFLMVRRNDSIVRVQVPAPAEVNSRPLKGDGWTLVPQKGWTLVPGDRAGDYVLKPGNGPSVPLVNTR